LAVVTCFVVTQVRPVPFCTRYAVHCLRSSVSAVRTAASDLLEALCGSYDVDVAALQLPLAVNLPVRGRGGVTRDMVHTAIEVLEVSLHLDAEALGVRFPPAGVFRCCCDCC
jgi:hypothetical protein